MSGKPFEHVKPAFTLFAEAVAMAAIHRPFIPGATVFLTTCLARRGSDLLVRHVDVLRDVARRTRKDKPFRIEAWVILPDHMHCVWTLPEGDADYPNRVGMLKARFSRALRERGISPEPASSPHGVVAGRSRAPVAEVAAPGISTSKDEAGFWQKRFWDHHIRDDADLVSHVAYCWHNPIKHGLVTSLSDWPYSSWHRDNAPWSMRSDGTIKGDP